MNNKKIGKDFERECIPILNEIFDKVEWLSGANHKSTFDFKGYKKGEEYYIEAKKVKDPRIKPSLNIRQLAADLVICKRGENLMIYTKGTFLGNLNIPLLKSKKAEKLNWLEENFPRAYRWHIKNIEDKE